MSVLDPTARQRVLDLPTGLQPVTPFWVTPDDILIVGIRNALAGVQVTAEGRIWTPEGAFIDPIITVSPGSTRALAYTSLRLDYGWLVAATVQATGATLPTRGQTYCTLQLGRPPVSAFRLTRGLASGYISGSQFLSWPYGRTADAIEGPGALYSLATATPAAGAEITQTVPTGARWKLRGMRASITTAAGGANRAVRFKLTDGTNTVTIGDINVFVGPSTTSTYSFIGGWPLAGSADPTEKPLFFPLDTVMAAGWIFGTSTLALAAGDQFTAGRFIVEEWLED